MKTSEIDRTEVGSWTVLTPQKSMTYQNCQEFKDLFGEVINQNKTEIILHCKSVKFFDSEALELLAKTHYELKIRGGALKIIDLSAVCRDILVATRLITVLYTYDDIHKAIKDTS